MKVEAFVYFYIPVPRTLTGTKKNIAYKRKNEQRNDESILFNPGYFVACLVHVQKSVFTSDL